MLQWISEQSESKGGGKLSVSRPWAVPWWGPTLLFHIHSEVQVPTQKPPLNTEWRGMDMESLPMFSTMNAVRNQNELREAEAMFSSPHSVWPCHCLVWVKGSTVVNNDEWLFTSWCCVGLERIQTLLVIYYESSYCRDKLKKKKWNLFWPPGQGVVCISKAGKRGFQSR